MKKLFLLFLLCFSFVTLAACDDDDPEDDRTQSMTRTEEGIMEELVDGVKSAFE